MSVCVCACLCVCVCVCVTLPDMVYTCFLTTFLAPFLFRGSSMCVCVCACVSPVIHCILIKFSEFWSELVPSQGVHVKLFQRTKK